MKALPWILIVLLLWRFCFMEPPTKLSMLSHPDTTEYVETIPFYYPVPKDSVVIRYKYAKLPVKKDTCKVKQDTYTPIRQKSLSLLFRRCIRIVFIKHGYLVTMRSWIVLRYIAGRWRLKYLHRFLLNINVGDLAYKLGMAIQMAFM